MTLLSRLQEQWNKLDTSHKAIIAVVSITILPIAVLCAYFALGEHFDKDN